MAEGQEPHTPPPDRTRRAAGRSAFLSTPPLKRLAVLLAVGVAAVLVSVLIFAPRRPRRHENSQMNCGSNLRQIGLAIKQYAQDHGGAFPPSFTELYPDYLDDAKPFSCLHKPSRWEDIQRTGTVSAESTSYIYVSGLRATDLSGCVLAFGRPGNHADHVYTLFLDGHVESHMGERYLDYLNETRELIEAQGRTIKLLYEKPPPGPSRWSYYAVTSALAVLVFLFLWRRHTAEALKKIRASEKPEE